MILFCFSFVIETNAQDIDSLKTYYFEGEEVVFEFDIRQYFLIGETEEGVLEFEDFEINEIIVSGSFNDWSRDHWKMKKVSQFIYQLRKPIKDFDDPFFGDLKFLINQDYWIKPPDYDSNSLRKESDPFWEEVFNVKMYDVKPDSNGNALFFLKGWNNTRQVILTGDFIGWDEHQLKMTRVADGWSCQLDLDPGRYEYKFIADGEWLDDPDNTKKVKNEHNTFNSILEITQEVVFTLKGFPDASRVELAGSFNDWNDSNHWMMEKSQEGWTFKTNLVGGKHFYKFIVDGEWMTDPDNIMTEHDWRGYVNSVLFVR